MSHDVLSPYATDNMATRKKEQSKTLKDACWRAGYSVTEICRALGFSRNTAYEAWKNPSRYPMAAPKLFNFLSHDQHQRN